MTPSSSNTTANRQHHHRQAAPPRSRESRFPCSQHRARRAPAPRRHQTGRAACCGRAAAARLSGAWLGRRACARARREKHCTRRGGGKFRAAGFHVVRGCRDQAGAGTRDEGGGRIPYACWATLCKLCTGSDAREGRPFTGFSHETLRKAEAVVAAAEANAERFGKLQADMDREGRANAVYRRLTNMQQGDQIRAEPPPLPSGRFRVAVADPPWPYDVREDDPTHLSATPYPQMSVADICALPVPSIPA